MLEYNDNVHIYPEKICSVIWAVLGVFIFADSGAGIGIHTTVHI